MHKDSSQCQLTVFVVGRCGEYQILYLRAYLEVNCIFHSIHLFLQLSRFVDNSLHLVISAVLNTINANLENKRLKQCTATQVQDEDIIKENHDRRYLLLHKFVIKGRQVSYGMHFFYENVKKMFCEP